MSVLEQNSRRKMLLGQDGNSLFLLLAINATLFVIISFVKIVYLMTDSNIEAFNNEVLNWIAIPANANVFLSRPWTLVTYMFTHDSILPLISSLLWLWCFGFILQDLSANKRIIPIYLYGGFVGSLVFLLTVNTIPALRAHVDVAPSLLGAGPAIMAIAIATTTLSPQYKIFPFINGGIPLWILTAVFVLINFATVGGSNVGYAMAQLSGGLIGFIFIWQMRKGNDWSDWMINLVTWVDDLFNPEKKHKKKIEKQRLFYRTEKKPFVKTPHVTQQRIDELLDKINQKGYHFLTDEEKEFLKKASSEEL
jgi:membrane associated rhomboid family serine protease